MTNRTYPYKITTTNSGNYITYIIDSNTTNSDNCITEISNFEYIPMRNTIEIQSNQNNDIFYLSNNKSKIKEFYNWLLSEQKDLEEESGADLSGVIDKLEEMFPEISEEEISEEEISEEDYFRRQVESVFGLEPGQIENYHQPVLGDNNED